MNDPIKIIWKYKNSNRRIQYNTYIFVGDMVPKEIMKILNNITDKNFYDMLISLSKNEYKKIESYYGERWYEKFFNVYHINTSINIMKESHTQKKEIEDKYGDEWYKTHVASRKLVEKDIIYSYEAMIKYENQHKKLKERGFAIGDDDIDVDYTTKKQKSIGENIDSFSKFEKNKEITDDGMSHSSSPFVPSITSNDDDDDDDDSNSDLNSISDMDSENDLGQFGGELNDEEHSFNYAGKYPFEEEFKISVINNFSKHKYTQQGGEIDQDSTQYDTSDEEQASSYEEGDETYDFLEDKDDEHIGEEETVNMEQIYEDDTTIDDEVTETSKLIKKALDDEKIFEKNISKMIDFDTSNNNSAYDNNLKDIYKKFYVTTQYIFKDDTVKTMKNKICCSLKCNPIFGNDLYLTPSRQYFWTEYFYSDKIQKVAIGQKWMRRNELLNIDIEPNHNIKVYEELRGQLKVLRNNMRRYNNKIRIDDDNNYILYDYDSYLPNNEIYMIDLYNEFGENFNPGSEALKNLQDIYLKIYYPRVKSEDIRYIIEFLNKQNKNEIQKNMVIFETINNDLMLENEIINTVENVRANEKYEHLFKENYITQSVIHVSLRFGGNTKLNLYKIFNEFILDDRYPFIQYQTTDGNITYKFSEKHVIEYFGKKENSNLLSKWFENAPYGISIKTKTIDKSGENFISINLNENGRIEYKTQWKEEDMATIDDIKKKHVHIYDLIRKMNSEKNRIEFGIPHENEFKYAFINTIQKFILPEKYIINHNDLSNFSRYFFPYISLVIDPKKRQSKYQKTDNKSKYGTYLRYKRVSKYENQARIEQRILYFIKNFEFTEKSLIDELSKQFNITEEKAYEEYERVRNKHSNIKKARKVLKKLENVPKYKPPGIGIDIQGKEPKKYKIRISGARDKPQLNRIISFMNILIHLYVETYLFKNPEKQSIKKKLEQLKNIATRRNKVDDFVFYEKSTSKVKQMTKIDKKRLGFKPEKGESGWTRACQNSGDDKKRRPEQYSKLNIDTMLKRGYLLNKKTGYYERKIKTTEKGKKKDIVLKAAKLVEYDEEGALTGNDIYYTCDPEENGEHYYVGFLTKSKNPYGQCMPCCFKKPQLDTTNKKKKEFIENCINPSQVKDKTESSTESGDKLYILQDTNKLHEGRIGFLPKYLDIYFNFALNKTKKIKHHYLTNAQNGYFFKYGSLQDADSFLNCIATLVDKKTQEIKENIYKFLNNDKNMQYFTSLNNGEIRNKFGTINDFIFYLKNTDGVDFDLLGDLLAIPGICTKNGLNIVVFSKKIVTINEFFEKEKIREDFYIKCQNIENVGGLEDQSKDCIFMINEEKNFHPVVMVTKEDENDKSLDIVTKFKYENKKNNIVHHISDFYEKSCIEQLLERKNAGVTAKVTNQILSSIKNSEYHTKYQYVDSKNKCKYLITKNNILVPVNPSGSMYNVTIIKNVSKYIKPYEETLEQISKLNILANKKIPLKQIGIYYDQNDDMTGGLDGNNKIMVSGIMTESNYLIPIERKEIKIKLLEEKKLLIEPNPEIEEIDISIEKGNIDIDQRIKNVNIWKYDSESYELFRFHFSDFINNPENKNIKTKIKNIMDTDDLGKKEKSIQIKLILYKLIDPELYERYKNIIKSEIQSGGKIVHLTDKIPDLNKYNTSNDRILCDTYDNKDKCNINSHCKWYHSSCSFISTTDNIIKMINKLCEELASDEMKAFELMQIDSYFVSDIGDYNKFTEREGQTIVKSTSTNINKILEETFGKDRIFYKSGKKRGRVVEANFQVLNQEYQMIDMKTFYLQKIVDDNMNLFRAYSNCYYWIKNKYSDIHIRNLGFYNPVQSDLSINFKSSVISWMLNAMNIDNLSPNIKKYISVKKSIGEYLEKFAIKLVNETEENTNSILELFVLNKINDIPIVIYDEYQTIIYIFDKDIIYNINSSKKPSSYEEYNKNNSYINMRFIFKQENDIVPEKIESIYYKK